MFSIKSILLLIYVKNEVKASDKEVKFVEYISWDKISKFFLINKPDLLEKYK